MPSWSKAYISPSSICVAPRSIPIVAPSMIKRSMLLPRRVAHAAFFSSTPASRSVDLAKRKSLPGTSTTSVAPVPPANSTSLYSGMATSSGPSGVESSQGDMHPINSALGSTAFSAAGPWSVNPFAILVISSSSAARRGLTSAGEKLSACENFSNASRFKASLPDMYWLTVLCADAHPQASPTLSWVMACPRAEASAFRLR